MPETELLLPIPTPPRAVIVLPEPSATAFAAPALALLPTAVALSSAFALYPTATERFPFALASEAVPHNNHETVMWQPSSSKSSFVYPSIPMVCTCPHNEE